MASISLHGKTALITGAAKRIGRATALALAEQGMRIVIHYDHSAAEAEALRDAIVAGGGTAWTIQADLGKAEDYGALIDRTLTLTGGLDALVNNASVFPPATLDDVTFADLMTNMEINAWAPFVLSRDFARRVGHGSIVNLQDSRLAGYDWKHVSYIASKEVLALFTRMTALAYAPAITVNAVAPGLILPPPGEDERFLDKLAGTVPLQRHGDAEDIAEAVVYLLRSTFITGQVLYVDGGRHVREYHG